MLTAEINEERSVCGFDMQCQSACNLFSGKRIGLQPFSGVAGRSVAPGHIFQGCPFLSPTLRGQKLSLPVLAENKVTVFSLP